MAAIEQFRERLTQVENFRQRMKRPFITISYAQSVNGIIASRQREQISLSGKQSLILTHCLRSLCDAILIGIGTVLSDNPQLTVRLVEGQNPQPIVLDTQLRIPLEANLVQRADLSLWVISRQHNAREKIERLRQAGVTIFPCKITRDGKIDLFALMTLLAEMNINSVMVEGGAEVITSFMNARLVDQFVITIAPMFMGGLQVIEHLGQIGSLQLEQVEYEHIGEDLVLWAQPLWEEL